MRAGIVLAIPALCAACTLTAVSSTGGPGPGGTPPEVSVDTGATIPPDKAVGAALYVEYAAGGHWHLFTTCDTGVSGTTCEYQVTITPAGGAQLSNVTGENLESNDTAVMLADGSIQLDFFTATATDDVVFDATPGAGIVVSMLLDGAPQPSYILAVSGGDLLNGVPGDPVELVPSAP